MSFRSIAVVAVLSVFAPKMPEQCNKMMGKGGSTATASAEPPPPPPPPPPSATTPPIWQPPDTTPTTAATTASSKPPPPDSDSALAKAAFDKKQYKTARAILEKKQKAGTATPEELFMLKETCEKLKDKACLTALKNANKDGELY